MPFLIGCAILAAVFHQLRLAAVAAVERGKPPRTRLLLTLRHARQQSLATPSMQPQLTRRVSESWSDTANFPHMMSAHGRTSGRSGKMSSPDSSQPKPSTYGDGKCCTPASSSTCEASHIWFSNHRCKGAKIHNEQGGARSQPRDEQLLRVPTSVSRSPLMVSSATRTSTSACSGL